MVARISWLLYFIVAFGGNFNPYKILEVSRKSTEPEINNAYRSLSEKFNPEEASDSQKPVFRARLTEINQAYNAVMASFKDGRPRMNSGQFVRLTEENFEHIVSRQEIWIIFVYSHYCTNCAKAREITEKACAYLEGMVKCGSISRDTELRLARDIGMRKAPAILLRTMGTKYQIPFSKRKTEISTILKAVSSRIPTKVREFQKFRYLESFLRKSGDFVRAVFVSESRTKPHILHRALAHHFREHAVFAFISLKNIASNDLLKLEEITGSNLDSPMVALFENPDLPPIVINLSSDMEQMIYKLDNALQRIPTIPKMQVTEYYERCYTNTASLFDTSKVCILLLLSNPAMWSTYQKKLVQVAEENREVQFMWVDCTKQTVFCNEWKNGSASNTGLFEQGSTLRILGIQGPQNMHALSPLMAQQPDRFNTQGLSLWVSDFLRNDQEITYHRSRCAFPRLKTGPERRKGIHDALGSILPTAGLTVTKIINLFSTLFFVLVFALLMFVVMSSRNGSFQVHFS